MKWMTLLLGSLLALNLWADNSASKDPYFEISKVEIRELTDAEVAKIEMNNNYGPGQPGTGIIIGPTPGFPGVPGVPAPSVPPKKPGPVQIIGDFIQIGEKIWKIIEANKPVVNLRNSHVSVLPLGTASPIDISGWKKPSVKTYMVSYENGFGMNVVEFVFRLVFSHSGNIDGKGAYIANAGLYPTNLSVAWGYTFNADTAATNAINIGTTDDPIANLELHLNWSVETVFKTNKRKLISVIDGLGNVEVYE